MTALKIILLIIGSYFIGNFAGARIFAKMKGDDISKIGSGTPGSMNVVRNYGAAYAGIVLFFDALRSAVCALAGMWLLGEMGIYIGGAFCVIGHIFPVIYKFKGGKGVACSLGMFAVANPLWGIVLFILNLVGICLIKYGSICSMSYVLAMGIIQTCVCTPNWASYTAIWVVVALVLIAHRVNIKALFTGKERKTELGSAILKMISKKKKDNKEVNNTNVENSQNASLNTESKKPEDENHIENSEE